VNVNFILKVTDAKAVDIKKALAGAGITVRSIQEVHKEEGAASTDAQDEGKEEKRD
jgi:hypothetical protein